MKATILWHTPVTSAASAEIYRFGFALEDGSGTPPYTGMVSLRTARVLVAELHNGTAFIGMLRAIVETLEADYDSLVGQQFHDSVDPPKIVGSGKQSGA
jgi:hypothetical protein